jgi:hypothetical protein
VIVSAPGKVFILGEYGVLAEKPALVAAFGPRFLLSSQPFEASSPAVLHPQSPAARLAAERGWVGPFYWRDPWGGAGGFGASSAQFLLLELLLDLDQEGLYPRLQRYRRFACGEGEIPPSGADYVAQTEGGVVCFGPVSSTFCSRPVGPALVRLRPRLELRVLQASQQPGRKVATHLHLGALGKIEPLARRLEPVVTAGLSSLEQGDAVGLGSALSAYGDLLASMDLEAPATRRDKLALLKIQGVLGVKGTGAMQADALVAAIDPTRWDSERWFRVVADLGLLDRGVITGEEPAAS